MPRFQGVGPRIRERLLEKDYRQLNGEPDVNRFCMEHRYNPNQFHEWIGDRKTPFKYLDRLATDLEVSRAWLLFGDEVPKRPTAMVAGALLLALTMGSVPVWGGTMEVGVNKGEMRLIGSYLRRWWRRVTCTVTGHLCPVLVQRTA